MFIPVHDPDAALGFYRDTLGLEVRNDVESDGFRWVTVGAPGQNVDIVLFQPHGGLSQAEGDALLTLVTQGSLQAAIFRSDDLDTTFEKARASGAEVLQEPTSQPWGAARLRVPRPVWQPRAHRPGLIRTDGDPMSKATRTTNTQSPALHDADSHDLIRVHGARVNNLKDISIEIPKRRLTVFTGVSGSGKSSLVFGTIAAESQRLINETYSAFVQGFMPTLARPEVDVLEGLTTAIIVDQERMGANVRSTVGTATDANAMLRILFSRLGKPHIGSANAFSFNTATISGAGAVTFEKGGEKKVEKRTFSRAGGMCPRCEGMGSVTDFDLSALYDDSKSLNEGAITIPGYSMEGWYGRIFRGCGFFDPDKPIRKFTKKELNDLLHKDPTKIKVEGINLTYSGLIPQIQKSFLSKDKEAMQPHIRAFVERAVTFTICPDCSGTRLNEAARSSKIKGISIADACAMQISDLAEWVGGLRRAVSRAVARRTAAHPRLVRRDRFGLPLARPTVGHVVGRRVATHQDDPPPRVVAHRRHLRVRRADDRVAPPRHPADERPAAAAARQGQHRAGRRAQARVDCDRRPRRRPRPAAPAPRAAKWCSKARSPGCAPATPSRGTISTIGHPSRSRCAHRRECWRCAAPAPTTCRTSTSISRSVCWW